MITVLSEDGTDSETITVTITGINGAAMISGDNDGDVVEDTTLTVSGTLSVTDEDSGEAAVPVLAGTAGDNGYGTFEVGADGAWTYTLDNSLAAVQALPAGATLTDMITVSSEDGTDSETITVTITGINGAAMISGDNDGDVVEDTTLTVSARSRRRRGQRRGRVGAVRRGRRATTATARSRSAPTGRGPTRSTTAWRRCSRCRPERP